MKTKLTLQKAINWEFVHAHHKLEAGNVQPGPWCQRIIEHARANGFTGKITERGACRIINRNLY
jgi:hypothetical protein